jgi:CubicO group peptidase (beta-lactamase class C family)
MPNTINLTPAQAETLGVDLGRLELLDSFLRRMTDGGEHPFAAFRVWRRGALAFSGDYGLQSPGGAPLRPDAIFALQSVTKPIVATCAAILQERGKINFFDRVQDYFPEFVGENKERVLLWHLLSHTSGMDEDEIYKRLEERVKIIEKTAKKAGFGKTNINKLLGAFWDDRNDIWDLPLTAMPGTRFSYWNFGYGIIKLVIEKVTGVSLEEYAREHIFEPLEMKDTHWHLPEDKRDRYALRPDGVKGMPWMNSEGMLVSDTASGGLKSTLDDVARFGLMYLGGGALDGKRIISPASVKLMTRNHNAGIPDSFWMGRWLGAGWGLGWDVKDDKIDDIGMLHSASSYNHGGYGGARLLVDPAHDLVVSIYMCEREEMVPYENMNRAADILYGALD